MKKKSMQLVILIISITLILGIFIAGQLNKRSSQKTEKGTTEKPKVVKTQEEPELKGGSENLNRDLEQRSTNAKVFYNSKKRTAKQIALTFDDGPDIYYTPKILDILRMYNIKATFFIIGSRAHAHPEMVQRIIKEGHTIGNHTWDHPLVTKLSDDKLREEVDETEKELFTLTGIRTAMFRPPYGALIPAQVSLLSEMGYSVIDWSVDTRDWAKTPVSQIMTLVKREVFPGGIILQHCAGGKGEDLSNTVKALPQIIELLRKSGYSFVPIQELLGINAAKIK